MDQEYSVVEFKITPFSLEKNKSYLIGLVRASNQVGIDKYESVVMTEPLVNRIFRRTKNLPINISAIVTLAKNEEPKILWKVAELHTILLKFSDYLDVVETLLDLKQRYVRVRIEEILEIQSCILSELKEFDKSESDRRVDKLLKDREQEFIRLVDKTLNLSSLLPSIIEKTLETCDTDFLYEGQYDNPLDCLIKLEESCVRVKHFESQSIQQTCGIDFMRRPSEAIKVYNQKCLKILKHRSQSFNRVVEEIANFSINLIVLTNSLNSSFILNSIPTSKKIVPRGVTETVPW